MNGSGPVDADDTRSTSRRLRRARLVSVALLAMWGALATSPAHADLHNPIPADCAFEEPSDFFTDADALCAYMTADLGGGRICIVRWAEDDPAHVSCDSPAFWRPTHIPGRRLGPFASSPSAMRP